MSGQGFSLFQGPSTDKTAEMVAITAGSPAAGYDAFLHTPQHDDGPSPRRRTPRTSLIVVLADDHVLSPERLAERLPPGERRDVDIIVACSGEPADLLTLKQTVGEAQFLLAPPGTSIEDLRELGIRQAPGEIVTLLSGVLLNSAEPGNRDRLQIS